jgi:hypothetical protein
MCPYAPLQRMRRCCSAVNLAVWTNNVSGCEERDVIRRWSPPQKKKKKQKKKTKTKTKTKKNNHNKGVTAKKYMGVVCRLYSDLLITLIIRNSAFHKSVHSICLLHHHFMGSRDGQSVYLLVMGSRDGQSVYLLLMVAEMGSRYTC